jgi:hypothetical protein
MTIYKETKFSIATIENYNFQMYNSAQINCSCREINSGNWSQEIRVKVHGHRVLAIRVVREFGYRR